MSSIILAYTVGVLCGVGYMYLRYHKMISNNLRELEEIRLGTAKNDGLLEALCTIKGVNADEFVHVAYICDRKFCEECNNPECNHVFDIRHARNFECIAENEYWEKDTDAGDETSD